MSTIYWSENDTIVSGSATPTPVLNSDEDTVIGPRSRVARYILDSSSPTLTIQYNTEPGFGGIGDDIRRHHRSLIVAFRITAAGSSWPSSMTATINQLQPPGTLDIDDWFHHGRGITFSEANKEWDLSNGHALNTRWIMLGGSRDDTGSSTPWQFIIESGIADSTEIYIDVGYVVKAIPTSIPRGIGLAEYAIRYIDGSKNQVSDGGQQYSTRVIPRRQVRFSFELRQDDDLRGEELFSDLRDGLIPIQESVGTVKPIVVVPSAKRLTSDLPIMGMVQEWPEITALGGQLWRQGPITINELV